MRGFMEGGFSGNYSVTVEFISHALEVLEWGRKTWKNVSREDRGSIFEDTFIRGVRSLHIDAFMKVCFQFVPIRDGKY